MTFSVLMSIYKNDNPDQLSEAIASTLEQTLPPSQFVIVGDGPLPPVLMAGNYRKLDSEEPERARG